MNGLNEVRLIGNLAADPELRYTQSSKAVLNFRMATNSRYKNAEGEYVERTEWHSLVLWGNRAEALAKILAKGMPVFVAGELRTSSWDDKETGTKRYKTEINVNDVILLGGKRDGAGAEADSGNSGSDDNIPF